MSLVNETTEGDEADCNNCQQPIVYIAPRGADLMWVHLNGEPHCTFYAEPKPSISSTPEIVSEKQDPPPVSKASHKMTPSSKTP